MWVCGCERGGMCVYGGKREGGRGDGSKEYSAEAQGSEWLKNQRSAALLHSVTSV